MKKYAIAGMLCASLLTACGNTSEPAESPTPATTQSTADGWSYVLVPTKNGQSVPCLVYAPWNNSNSPSISCNWNEQSAR